MRPFRDMCLMSAVFAGFVTALQTLPALQLSHQAAQVAESLLTAAALVFLHHYAVSLSKWARRWLDRLVDCLQFVGVDLARQWAWILHLTARLNRKP